MKYNFKGFSEKANEALNNAIISAEELGHTYVGSEHILLGILNTDDSVALSALKKFDITAEKLESQMRKTIGSGTATRLSPDYFTPRAKRVIETAVKGAASLGKSKVGTEYLLVGILSESDTYAVRFLNEIGVDVASVTRSALEVAGISLNDISSSKSAPNMKKGGTNNNSTLSKYGRDLTEEAREGVSGLLRRAFRPEFLNRLDEIIFYKPLTRENIDSIVTLQLADLQRRLAQKQVRITMTDAARDHIVAAAYDPLFGARPLKRYLQSKVETLVARKMIREDIEPGTVLQVDVADGGLVIL